MGLEEGGVAEGTSEVGIVAVFVVGEDGSEGGGGKFLGVLEAGVLLNLVVAGLGGEGAEVDRDFPVDQVFAGEGGVGFEVLGGVGGAEGAGDESGFGESLDGGEVGVGFGQVGVEGGGGGASEADLVGWEFFVVVVVEVGEPAGVFATLDGLVGLEGGAGGGTGGEGEAVGVEGEEVVEVGAEFFGGGVEVGVAAEAGGGGWRWRGWLVGGSDGRGERQIARTRASARAGASLSGGIELWIGCYGLFKGFGVAGGEGQEEGEEEA